MYFTYERNSEIIVGKGETIDELQASEEWIKSDYWVEVTQ